MYMVVCGIMAFESFGFGHRVISECLKTFVKNFNGNIWNTNGPMVITNTLRSKFCNTQFTYLMNQENCHGFRVYRPDAFYAIYADTLNYFFEEKFLDICLQKTKNSLVIHLWNKLSASITLSKNTTTCYGFLANRHCPRVYRSSGGIF